MAKVALLIGVSEYEVGLNPLPAAVKDVVALERILKDSEMGDFDEVKILTNPEPQAMQYEVETLFTSCSRDDFVLLFFSGHGIKDEANNLYFATRITKKLPKGNLIKSTAVPAKFIHDVMNGSRAKRQAIILDCCFSGAFDPSLQSKGDDGSVDLQGQLGSEGRVVLTSSSSTQYSFEQQGSDLSLYTRYLIEGIETGAGDRNEDGKISMLELHDYATSRVQETAPSMTPKLITLKDLGFDLVLAKAKVTDPKLRYRRQVEKYSSRGAISSIGRTILDKLQTQLGLSSLNALKIETEVLRPYQERLDNIKLYQDEFAKAVKHEYPLSSHILSELEEFLKILGLRREDIDSVEQEIITRFQTVRSEYPISKNEATKKNPKRLTVWVGGVVAGSILSSLALIALLPFINQQNRQADAKGFTSNANHLQHSFYLKKSKFASNTEELGYPINLETTYYSHKNQAYNSGKNPYTISTAVAKQSGFKSYIGGVFVVTAPNNSEPIRSEILCESTEPTTSPPSPPTLVGQSPQCASGTTPIQ